MKTSKLLTIIVVLLATGINTVQAQTANMQDRGLWGSICAKSDVTTSDNPYLNAQNKVLLTWRMLPGDTEDTAFNLWRKMGEDGNWVCVNDALKTGKKGIKATNYQHAPLSTVTGDIYYRLTYADPSKKGADMTCDDYIGEYTMKMAQAKAKEPFITIPLKDTKDVYDGDDLEYQANDVSVGDLDGDGQFEIVVKRLQSPTGHADGGTGASYSSHNTIYAVIWDAYKLDGTFLWRIKGGPGIILGNSSAFAIADFDGDGCAEMAIRTCEGTVFGDGQEIPDTNGDGKIDYRTWGNENSSSPGWVDHYNSAGPEFISIIDGKTGRELARDNYIARETSQAWGDDYWKRACSFRVGVACFDKLPSVVFGRGVYARSVLEAWDYRDGQLTKRWRFDSSKAGGKDTNKDGKANSAYAGQGNHSFNVADLDGDGKDEVMYGSMAIDDDGYGLWSTGLGHGDANHVGKFLPDREGLQVWHCLENGTTMVALHDAKDGSVIWKKEGSSDNDTGRCLVADIDPDSPGCEFWWAGSNAYSQTGQKDLGYQPSSCNMAIWFDGGLSRQLINENIINNDRAGGRTFTMYRWSEHFINGSKSNPSWYGDMLGDWREEVIVPDGTLVDHLKIFSTWYPTDHRFPWLMTDHTYWMQCLNENIGYNQPTQLGYYLGSDLNSDQEAWAAAAKVEADRQDALDKILTGIDDVRSKMSEVRSGYYTLNGQKVDTPRRGLYIHNGRKVVVK